MEFNPPARVTPLNAGPAAHKKQKAFKYLIWKFPWQGKRCYKEKNVFSSPGIHYSWHNLKDSFSLKQFLKTFCAFSVSSPFVVHPYVGCTARLILPCLLRIWPLIVGQWLASAHPRGLNNFLVGLHSHSGIPTRYKCKEVTSCCELFN